MQWRVPQFQGAEAATAASELPALRSLDRSVCAERCSSGSKWMGRFAERSHMRLVTLVLCDERVETAIDMDHRPAAVNRVVSPTCISYEPGGMTEAT